MNEHYIELSKSCRRSLYNRSRDERLGQLALIYCDWGEKLESGMIPVSVHQEGLLLIQATVVLAKDLP